MASGSTDSPATRFTKSPLGYVRSDGVEIAASWDALVSGTLAAPIDRDELKEQVTRGFSVWSNATSNGNAFAPGDNASSCSGINGAWSASGTGTGRVGDLSKTDAKWADSTAQDCFSTLRIYCFQQ